jgi:hypothetical protein
MLKMIGGLEHELEGLHPPGKLGEISIALSDYCIVLRHVLSDLSPSTIEDMKTGLRICLVIYLTIAWLTLLMDFLSLKRSH